MARNRQNHVGTSLSAGSGSGLASVVVLDLGGYTAKVGMSTDSAPRILSNCVFKAKSEKKRQFVSGQLAECKDQHQLFHMYPFNSGYLTNWELQERVLDYFFGSEVLKINTQTSQLIVTESYFNLQYMKKSFAEAMFEGYEFQSLFVCPPAYLSSHLFQTRYPDEHTCLVVDSGHSFTHIIPVINGSIAWNGVLRVPVGGKVLTNHLKQRVTLTQLDVMDETTVMNQIKELTCFVSTDLAGDFRRGGDDERSLTRTCVLPDYATYSEPFVRPVEDTFNRPTENEQLIRLDVDRFLAPEILFHPSVIGDERKGIAEACVESVRRFAKEEQYALFRNIVLTGGNCKLEGFKDRLVKEIEPEVPEFGQVEAMMLGNPITTAWHGGKAFAESPLFEKLRVTKAEYEEKGETVCDVKFIRPSSKSLD